MMRYGNVYTMILVLVFCISGKGQNKTDLPKGKTKSETKEWNTSKEVISSYGPNSMVRTIRQDRNGNIWLASVEGIIRYDGKSFTNITSKVMSARFFCVLEDTKGNFWIASIGSGVWYYDGKSFQNFTTREGLASNRVFFIYEDKTGNIWFSTEGGATRYNGKSFQNYKMSEGFDSGDDNDVNSIIEDKTGKFWIGTRGKARVYDYDARLPDGQEKTFTIPTHDGRPFMNVRCIMEDKKGNIWLAGSHGLWRYDGNRFIQFTTDFVCYVYEDKNGNIWTTSDNGGRWALSRYDEKSLSAQKPTITEIKSQPGMLLGILEDHDGNIWFGSDGGVYRYDGNTITDFKAFPFDK